VVGNIRQDIYEEPLAELDFLIESVPVKDRADLINGMSLVLRFDGDAGAIVPALRSALHDVDPTIPFKEANTLSNVVAETLIFERMESWLFGIFAALALTLALVGLYGLVSHEVDQATRDIGVRMALGAARRHILEMVLRRVLWMLAAGTAAGLVLTLMARRLIGMVIYFDGQKEVGGFLLLALLLVIAGLAAALIPAVRAASIDPMKALRAE
jgi:ABC-type antimicrobial peptide transport system permease subunit